MKILNGIVVSELIQGFMRPMWRMPMLCTALLIALAGQPLLQGQTNSAVFDARHLDQPADLNNTWLIHVEEPTDNPQKNASPALDDSHWKAYNLTDSLQPLFPTSDKPRVVWYRKKITVDPARTGLALRAGTIARAFEVYINGERLMTSGQVSPMHPYSFDAQILARIPDRMLATGSLLVAVRVGISGGDWRTQFPGLSAGNLTLGQESTLYQQDWLQFLGGNFFRFLDAFLIIALGFVALSLFIAQPLQYEYLWIFGLGLMRLCELPIQAITVFENIPIGWTFLSAAFTIASPLLWVSMYFAFVGIRIGWRFRAFLCFAGVLNAYTQLGGRGLAPNLPGAYGLLSNLPFVGLLSIVIPIILVMHLRRGNREAGILLIPVILFSLFIYASYVLGILLQFPAWSAFARRGFLLIQSYPAGPFSISLDNVSGIGSTACLAVIMILRSTRTSRRQAQFESELEAAREVQQVMLPEQQNAIPGFEIESTYLPAQQVGGDFFQVMPTTDGGLLLVIGDVAGKGLPAAMMVSVLVGATRTAAAYSNDPGEILAQLNERLVGRSRGGFSTALAVHITADGLVTLANAGHLSPYLDGGEVESLGALPLGILNAAEYPSAQFSLARGSRLTFYTDGVVEAQDAHGHLLGFDQGQLLSTRPAAEIVETARLFGQSDDITVVAIARKQ